MRSFPLLRPAFLRTSPFLHPRHSITAVTVRKMPKATKTKTSSSARKDPIAKPSSSTRNAEPSAENSKPPTRGRGRPKKDSSTSQPADPKTSHLYTDDNPSTTLHGTGFKDATTAHQTLTLISKRSLTYQFQTVNTLYHRAKHHPAMKKGDTAGNEDMRAAVAVFENWLQTTYPAAKESLREGGFKPLLSKGYVEKQLPSIRKHLSPDEEAVRFAEMYTSLGRNKRLGNVLLDDSKPEGPDWEVRRYEALCELVPEGSEWEETDLWEGGEKKNGLGRRHLSVVAWGWSPVQERSLP